MTRITDPDRIEKIRQELYRARRKSPRPTCQLSFEGLLELFDDASLTAKARAHRAGISEDSMSRLYRTYFQILYGDRSCLERYKEYHRQEAATRKRHLGKLLALPWVRHFYAHATEAGHAVEPCIAEYCFGSRVHTSERRVLKSSVMVSGKRCLGFPLTSVYKSSRSGRRARILISREALAGVEACICPVMVPDTDLHTLVIPSRTVLEVLEGRRAEKPLLYIPLGSRLADPEVENGFDPHLFNNAWNLIPVGSAR